MAILSKYPPASERTGSSASRTNYGSVAAHPHPYLVTAQRRRLTKVESRYLPLFPHEPEDACLTGSTRSLYRRALGLNIAGDLGRMKATSVSTFTDSKIA
jgi:hypothetical protein